MTTTDETAPSAAIPADSLPRPRSARAHVSATQPTGLDPAYTPTDADQPVHRSS